ncbi:MAG: hypothetical protein K8R85_04410 [Bacteroidetes bacterium]|nr:hypothetical protein [Bacteroidota bacterium]
MDNKIPKIKDRVLQIAKYKAISYETFFPKIGMTYGNFKGEAKKTPLNSDTIGNILSIYPEINSDWLITGKGEMIKSGIVDNDDKVQRIPLVPASALASKNFIGVQINGYEIEHYFTIPVLKERVDFIVQIEGESMFPTYENGTYLACKAIEIIDFKWEQAYLITVNHAPMLKRLLPSVNKGNLLCRSDNPKHRDFEIKKEDITSLAKILASIRLE